MNIKDALTYLSMIPMAFGIIASLAFVVLFGATGVAGIVIGLAELLHAG